MYKYIQYTWESYCAPYILHIFQPPLPMFARSQAVHFHKQLTGCLDYAPQTYCKSDKGLWQNLAFLDNYF